jgi:hypothetical protein
MTDDERREEAAAALAVEGGDPSDPLDVALVVEAALSAPPAPQENHAGSLPVEGCREKRASCNEPVAATGRCMTCGATRRAPPAPVAPVAPVAPHDFEGKAVTVEGLRVAPPPSDVPLLYRVKAATAWSDRAIGEAAGISRSAVQAYAGGRLAENLTAENRASLRAALAAAVTRIQTLIAEL